jgi:hypothetical protein
MSYASKCCAECHRLANELDAAWAARDRDMVWMWRNWFAEAWGAIGYAWKMRPCECCLNASARLCYTCADSEKEDARDAGFAEAIADAAKVIAAYLRDRAAQYNESSGSRCALEEVAAEVKIGEAQKAYEHGELDDLLKKETRR